MSRAATFRFYAELNDFLAADRRGRECEWPFTFAPSLKDAIEAQGVPHGEVDLVLVDGAPAALDETLRDGVRVAVYPVFEALDIAGVTRARTAPLREPKFLLDVHLGRLAAYLRLLGFDATYERDLDDAGLARRSVAEHRILLTRDVGLLKRREVTHGLFVRATRPAEQLREIVRRLHLQRLARPFSRCTACNGLLAPADKHAIEAELPALTRERVQEFRRCASCRKIYWAGAHHARQRRLIDAALAEEPGP